MHIKNRHRKKYCLLYFLQWLGGELRTRLATVISLDFNLASATHGDMMSKLNSHPPSPSPPIAPHIGLRLPITRIFANTDFNRMTSRYVHPISGHLRTQNV